MRCKNLLLLSSSRVGTTEYLSHALDMIDEHLNNDGSIKEILFIPYAGVTMSYDEYTTKVKDALSVKNINVVGLHSFTDPQEAIRNAKAIAVGGGNTFHLLSELYKNDLVTLIKERVEQGMKYIGWSAGSNVAGISIKTTNDMPIIEPPSFNALNLVNVQLNPHYTDYNPPGHNGETREERLTEFMVINPTTPIVGIVEGTALKITGNKIELIGPSNGYIFKNCNKTEVNPNTEISEYL
jgi:dipeptidase E